METEENEAHSSRTIHDDEAELGVRVEELHEDTGLELVVTSVESSAEAVRVSVSYYRLSVCREMRQTHVLMGLCGSKSKETFFSLPSSVRMVPTYKTRPFGGTE